MLKSYKKIWQQNWVIVLIVAQPILDILAFFFADTALAMIPLLVRMVSLIVICLGALIYFDKKEIIKMVLVLLPLGVFMVLHLLVSGFTSVGAFYHDFKYMITVMQVPILAVIFSFFIKKNEGIEKQIKKGILIAGIMILVSVLLALVTGTMVYTYHDYGLTGWFTSPNTQSMILVAIAPITVLVCTQMRKLWCILLAYAGTFFLLFCNGTRSCYYAMLALFIVMIYNAIFRKNESKMEKVRGIFIPIVFLAAGIAFYTFSPTDMEQDNRKDAIEGELTPEEIKEKQEFDKAVRIYCFENTEEYELLSEEDVLVLETLCDSYLYAELMEVVGIQPVIDRVADNLSEETLADNRRVKRIYSDILFDDAGTLTHLFGLNYADVEKNGYDMENDISAIFYYYGYIGICVYFAYLLYFIVISIGLVIKDWRYIFDEELVTYLFTVVLLVAGGQYSGAFLRKPNANIYMALILALIYLKSVRGKRNLDSK